MKPAQQKRGAAEKKPTEHALMSAARSVPAASASQQAPTGGSPSGAVWSRYIDSRMKQFGTR